MGPNRNWAERDSSENDADESVRLSRVEAHRLLLLHSLRAVASRGTEA